MPKQLSKKKNLRDLDAPELFFNRELSWLEFNARVLEEAQDVTNPILERLKFLTIVSSNLDEFFEIRVAGLQQQADTQPTEHEADGLTPAQVLDAIAARVQETVGAQYACYQNEIVPDLAQAGIDLHTVEDLSTRAKKWIGEYFEREVFPVLTPLAIDPAHPFPQLLNKSLNLAVALTIPDAPGELDGFRPDEHHEGERFGVVQVPRVLPRLVALPPEIAPANRRVYVFLSSIVSTHVARLFPGLTVEGCYAFRITRNSEMYLDEDEADNLLEAMREQLQRRRRGDAVRLEVQRGCDPAVVEMLLETFDLEPIDLYEVDGPINLPRLMTVYAQESRPDLKDAPFTGARPKSLRNAETPDELFAAIRGEDILLHHPYDSFGTVIDFIETAAKDPNVLAIKQTLYRTGGDSPIVRALMRAAENGKQVTALVELKARFDEENNIQWARALEEAGVHVLYGLVGFKTHCKMCLVVRHEGDQIRRYVHLGTGNYNRVTARLYTDIGLLTARREIGDDAAKVFNLLTGMSQFPGLEKLKMAPFGLHTEFKKLIDREAAHARKLKSKSGKSKKAAASTRRELAPRIIAKMNSLVDPQIIRALYRASQAGVEIDLIVRGICCLRPGVEGVSENIRVRSIVDRFLEHPRIFYFANGGDDEIFCGSADWMPRNFFRRIEVVFPVEDAALKAKLRDEVLGIGLRDNVKARLLQSDGASTRARPKRGEAAVRSQAWFLTHARDGAEAPASFLDERATAAPPSLPANADETPIVLTVRAAPQGVFAPSSDGRAGTSEDPVLQSEEAQMQSEDAQQISLRSEEASAASVDADVSALVKSAQPKPRRASTRGSQRAAAKIKK